MNREKNDMLHFSVRKKFKDKSALTPHAFFMILKKNDETVHFQRRLMKNWLNLKTPSKETYGKARRQRHIPQ